MCDFFDQTGMEQAWRNWLNCSRCLLAVPALEACRMGPAGWGLPGGVCGFVAPSEGGAGPVGQLRLPSALVREGLPIVPPMARCPYRRCGTGMTGGQSIARQAVTSSAIDLCMGIS